LQFSTGSLLDGLSLEERQEIVLLVLNAHTNPAKHPDAHSNWLHNIVDETITSGERLLAVGAAWDYIIKHPLYVSSLVDVSEVSDRPTITEG
jgi:hypothetical protein